MKLMKHITIALVLCAIPAMAFGQQVSCAACTHDVSVFQGDGGFIAEADGAAKVTWVASCGGVTQSGELTANAEGMVSMQFSDSGIACSAGRNGRLQIGPVKDGGWYWLTDATNSAVGSLVSQDILGNDAVKVTNAGPGVSMTAGRGAVLLREAATGRVGILPTILPAPPTPAASKCGPRRVASWPNEYRTQATDNCQLGGGRTNIRLIGPGAHNSRGVITDGTVVRPTTGFITVNADLWLDESGSFSTDDSVNSSPSPESMRKGWLGTTTTAALPTADHGKNWLDTVFIVSLVTDGPVGSTAGLAGIFASSVNHADSDSGSGSMPPGQAKIVIQANTDYCPARGTQYTATVDIFALQVLGLYAAQNAVHPAVATGRAANPAWTTTAFSNTAAATRLNVVCAPRSSAASEGEDLVPENPFPVSE